MDLAIQRPLIEREAVSDHRSQVKAAGDEVEVVEHRVLGDAAYLFDAEPVPPVPSSLSDVSTVCVEPIVS